MFLNSLISILRNFKRHSNYVLINMIGLALGVSISSLIFLFVVEEVSYDKFNRNYDHIYRLEREDWGIAGPYTGKALAEKIPGIKNFVRLDYFGFSNSMISWKDVKLRVPYFILADTGLFSVFTIDFVEGNPRKAFSDPNNIVLTQSMAKSIFGSVPAIGQTLRVNSSFDLTVSGIIKDPKNFHIPLQILAPFELLRRIQSQEYMNSFGAWNHPTYFLLERGVDPNNVEEDINSYLVQMPVFKGKDPGYRLRPLKELYFADDIRYECLRKHGNINYVYLFVGVGLLILIIAIINFINLTTARAPLRAKEVGLRKVLGGNRSSLTRLFLYESLFYTFFAFGVALLGIYLILPYFNLAIGANISYEFFSNYIFWICFISGIIIVGLLSGFYPAFMLSSFSPLEAFGRGNATRSNGVIFRRGLIIFQFTVSVVLIIFTLAIFRQLHYFRNQELGIRTNQIVYTGLNSDIRSNIQVFKDRVMSIPEVNGVVITEAVPGNVCHQRTWPVSLDEGVQYTFLSVEPDFAELYGLEFVEGRNLLAENEADRGGEAVILNETAVKAFGLKPPYVNSYQLPGRKGEIRVIGVVKDFHFNSLHEPIAPLVISWNARARNYISIQLSGKELSRTLKEIRNIWSELSPNFPCEMKFLDESFSALYSKEERFAKLFIGFSLLAILIATLGLFGLAAFTTEQRKKEIGVRKVLGASERNIIYLFLSDFGRWVLIAGIIAIPIAYWGIRQWLNNFPYRIMQTPIEYLLSLILCVFIAMFTVWYHTYKAANLNPVETIKYE